MTTLAAVACLVGLLIVAAVAWSRSRLDHPAIEGDLDEVALAAEYDRQRGYDRPREERAGPPIFAATVADFPGVVFTPVPRPKWSDYSAHAFERALNDDRLLDLPCPVCGATGTDGCRTTTGGEARRTHRSRAAADPDGGRAYRAALYDEAGDGDE